MLLIRTPGSIILRRAGLSTPLRARILAPICLLGQKSFLNPRSGTASYSMRWSPKLFFQKTVTNFKQEPFLSLGAFFLVYEALGIVPFLSVWYVLYNHEYLSLMVLFLFFPEFLVNSATSVVDNLLKNSDIIKTFSIHDTARLLITGAKTYLITRVLGPVRIVLAFSMMNWALRVVVRPIKMAFTRRKVMKDPDFKKLPKRKL